MPMHECPQCCCCWFYLRSHHNKTRSQALRPLQNPLDARWTCVALMSNTPASDAGRYASDVCWLSGPQPNLQLPAAGRDPCLLSTTLGDCTFRFKSTQACTRALQNHMPWIHHWPAVRACSSMVGCRQCGTMCSSRLHPWGCWRVWQARHPAKACGELLCWTSCRLRLPLWLATRLPGMAHIQSCPAHYPPCMRPRSR